MTQQPTTREKIGVTQQAFADFLGVSISQLAMAEIKQRSLPTQALLTISQIEICLLQPQAENDALTNSDINKIDKRYKDCLLQIATAKRQLEKLLLQYQQCINAMAVTTNLPAMLPQATNAQLEWLAMVAQDTQQKLTTCGKAQQQLLQVKITALETEAAALLPLLSPL